MATLHDALAAIGDQKISVHRIDDLIFGFDPLDGMFGIPPLQIGPAALFRPLTPQRWVYALPDAVIIVIDTCQSPGDPLDLTVVFAVGRRLSEHAQRRGDDCQQCQYRLHRSPWWVPAENTPSNGNTGGFSITRIHFSKSVMM